MNPIHVRLRELRDARGWTQVELAERAGVTRATVSRIEGGKVASLDLEVFEKLANALDVHPAILITTEETASIIQREAVSKERLLELLNEALGPVSDGWQFDGPVYQLREPDETGCNWSDSLQLRRGGGGGQPSIAVVARAVQEVRRRYNLAD